MRTKTYLISLLINLFFIPLTFAEFAVNYTQADFFEIETNDDLQENVKAQIVEKINLLKADLPSGQNNRKFDRVRFKSLYNLYCHLDSLNSLKKENYQGYNTYFAGEDVHNYTFRITTLGEVNFSLNESSPPKDRDHFYYEKRQMEVPKSVIDQLVKNNIPTKLDCSFLKDQTLGQIILKNMNSFEDRFEIQNIENTQSEIRTR